MTTATVDTQNREDAKKFANLIGPMDAKLDREVREQLITARVGMLLRASFFGNLATRMRLVNADEWLTTAATDGRNFYYNTAASSRCCVHARSSSCLAMRYYIAFMITLDDVVTVTPDCSTSPTTLLSTPTSRSIASASSSLRCPASTMPNTMA